jgi:hypothetical protein
MGGNELNEQSFLPPARKLVLEKFGSMARGIVQNNDGLFRDTLGKLLKDFHRHFRSNGSLYYPTSEAIISGEEASRGNITTFKGRNFYGLSFGLPTVGNRRNQVKAHFIIEEQVNFSLVFPGFEGLQLLLKKAKQGFIPVGFTTAFGAFIDFAPVFQPAPKAAAADGFAKLLG